MNAIIQDIMRPFGVTPRYAGFPMLVASVELYLEDPNRLSAVIDEIYKPAAHLCRGTFSLSPPRFRRLQACKSNY